MPYTENRETWYSGQGLWADVPAEQWNDWTWQLKNRITTLDAVGSAHDPDARGTARVRLRQPQAGARDHAVFFQPDRSRRSRLPDPQAGDPARGRNADRAGGNARLAGRGRTLARARPGAPLSGPRAVPGDRSVRGLLPLLHAQPAGQQRAGLQFSSGVRAGTALHRESPRGARRAALRRRSAAAVRPQARAPAQPAARNPARGIHPHRLAHPGLPAAAHHAGAVRDFQEARSDLDEHPRQSSAGMHAGTEGRVRAAGLRGRAAGQPVACCCAA